MTDFEDPRQLYKCIQSDCQADRAGNTPFCARHLREQEQRSAGISEPDVEAKAKAAGDAAMRDEQIYMGPDPDVNGLIASEVITMGKPPDPSTLEPHWDGTQWVLKPRSQRPDLDEIRSLVRQLMHELGIYEANHPA